MAAAGGEISVCYWYKFPFAAAFSYLQRKQEFDIIVYTKYAFCTKCIKNTIRRIIGPAGIQEIYEISKKCLCQN